VPVDTGAVARRFEPTLMDSVAPSEGSFGCGGCQHALRDALSGPLVDVPPSRRTTGRSPFATSAFWGTTSSSPRRWPSGRARRRRPAG